MNGKDLTAIVDAELARQHISKMQFYEECGISSATFSQWKNGIYEPSYPKIQAIERFLGIKLQDSIYDEDTMQLHELLKNRPEIRTLLKSVSSIPPSSVYSLISFVEKEKESAT